MKNILLMVLIVVALSITGCMTTTKTSLITTLVETNNFYYDPSGGYIPVEPEEAKSIIEISKNNKLVKTDIRNLSSDELRAFLTNSDQRVVVSKVNETGKLTYLVGSYTQEEGHYVAVMDYSNYVIDDLVDSDSKILGKAKIGIGLRMIASIQTRKKGIDLGSLFKIGLAASKQELSGEMIVKVIGLTSKDILNSMPGNFSSIDETAIQSALEGMATVKSKIYDPDTKVSAKILSIKLYKSSIGNTSKLLPPTI